MAEYYFDEFQDYLQTLCEKHVDVQHNVDGRSAFARLFSNEEMEALVNNASPNIVVVSSFFGRAAGSVDEQAMLQTVTIRFASNAAADGSAGINVAMAKAWQIMWDFIARMRQDIISGADGCDELTGAQLQNMSWDEIRDAPFLENHYGWELTLPFKSYQPAYNAAKWIS
jgi:hypothetical protein